MQETDKNRILNFLVGNESTDDFQSWVYHDSDLESRIGADLYFELIDTDYKDKSVLYNLRKVVLGNYIPENDFENFKYITVLQDSGWYQNRSIDLNLSKLAKTPAIQNAVNTIKEFGGLKFISQGKKEHRALSLLQFLEAPGEIENMREYGLNKRLVCFAVAHNDYVNLFVDEDNRFYKLDNVVAENLYEYKGLDFKQMMRELLELEEKDNFQIVGRKKEFVGRKNRLAKCITNRIITKTK